MRHLGIEETRRARARLFWVFGISLFVSLALGCCPTQPDHWNLAKKAKAVVTVLWVIVPPMWFYYEYFFTAWEGLEGEHWAGGENFSASEKLSRFNYGQDISAKVWLAVTTALLMLYFGKDLH
jgi:hypothetical protein